MEKIIYSDTLNQTELLRTLAKRVVNEGMSVRTLETIADKEINTPAILVIGDVINVFKQIKGIE